MSSYRPSQVAHAASLCQGPSASHFSYCDSRRLPSLTHASAATCARVHLLRILRHYAGSGASVECA